MDSCRRRWRGPGRSGASLRCLAGGPALTRSGAGLRRRRSDRTLASCPASDGVPIGPPRPRSLTHGSCSRLRSRGGAEGRPPQGVGREGAQNTLPLHPAARAGPTHIRIRVVAGKQASHAPPSRWPNSPGFGPAGWAAATAARRPCHTERFPPDALFGRVRPGPGPDARPGTSCSNRLGPPAQINLNGAARSLPPRGQRLEIQVIQLYQSKLQVAMGEKKKLTVMSASATQRGQKLPQIGPLRIATVEADNLVIKTLLISLENLRSELVDSTIASQVRNFARHFDTRSCLIYEGGTLPLRRTAIYHPEIKPCTFSSAGIFSR